MGLRVLIGSLGSGDAANEEFAAPTIFPFLVRCNDGDLGADQLTTIYRDLNRDIAAELPALASDSDRVLAARLCHIGQPVKLSLQDGSPAAALRIAIGSRSLLESWSPGEHAARHAIERILAEVSVVIQKIELLLKHQARRSKFANIVDQSVSERCHDL